jgi:hypothetical protein
MQKTLIILLVVIVCLDSTAVFVGVPYAKFSMAFDRDYQPDIIVSSPDGRHELVVREWSFLMGGGVEIYIREPGRDEWYQEQWIHSGVLDDGHPSFTMGQYRVQWESDRVTVCYYEALSIETPNDPTTWRGRVTYVYV